MDFWDERKQFEQSGQFVVNDWTNKTLTLDIQNSIGELYHFEIEPNASTSGILSRSTDDPDGKNILHIHLPIITGEYNAQTA